MRIDLTQASASQISSEPSAKQVKSDKAAAYGQLYHEDRTTFTSNTESLGSLVSAAMSSPEVRQDKVDSLKAAISSGSYQLDPQQIAASMLDEHA